MPHISHNGHSIFFQTVGRGPLVLLLHGHLLTSEYWLHSGFVEGFSDAYTVVLIDALGHGRSHKPVEAAAYKQDEQAGGVIAVLDALRAESAHVIGHSMGGWTAVGLAQAHPKRLRCLTLGGWDPVTGVAAGFPPGMRGSFRFEQVLTFARTMAPDLVAWVTPEAEPGLRASWEALADLAGAEAALMASGSPLVLWSGLDDPRGVRMQAFADEHRLAMIWTPGDHLSMVLNHGRAAASKVRIAIEAL